ncbi:MAG: T9SS type A sorting domain-containing protein [Flavobacteriales bacterium]|jgi:hypothetical protein|nr:T9SS type A sorting domain-containing protein [Flavobacteriales bacterium]
MKSILIIGLVFILGHFFGQNATEFSIEIEPLTITNAPGVHSYSWGKTSDGKWVVFGGRIDGLHRRQPFAAFLEQDNNKQVYVIDPVGNQVWSKALSTLPASLFEQLQATNQQFYQRDSILYITGGYGYSATENDHITYPYLSSVSLNELARAIINQESIITYFRQINDSRFAVTGGQMGYLNNQFYIVGGQLFDGRYNPMGPNNGPGFIQEYSEKIKRFNLMDDGVNLSVSNYTETVDATNLHRRDYNMAPQIFPNGELGYTAFSGVFQPTVDLPFLNSVDITATNHQVNNGFSQYLSQYHSAKLPVYDGVENAMNTIFFGGMSQYTLDNSGNLVQDDNVPFVKTISKVVRYSNGTMNEIKLPIEMPTLVGSGAEFIPFGDYFNHEILYLDSLPLERTLIGYVFGGIESTGENIFFINDGTQSSASNIAYKVYLTKGTTSIGSQQIKGQNVLNLKVYPNSFKDDLQLEFYNPSQGDLTVTIYSLAGKQLHFQRLIDLERGTVKKILSLGKLAKGVYKLELTNGIEKTVVSILKE